MQFLLREEHAHLLGQLLEVRAHMPFQVVFPLLFRFTPGSPDMEGDVLLRQTPVEFLNLKASHDRQPCAASLEDQHTVGRTKIQSPEHRS